MIVLFGVCKKQSHLKSDWGRLPIKLQLVRSILMLVKVVFMDWMLLLSEHLGCRCFGVEKMNIDFNCVCFATLCIGNSNKFLMLFFFFFIP